jgi:hypothetical protein
MTTLSTEERRGLEEIFIVLDNRKRRKMELLRKYLMFYKCMRMISLKQRF